MATQQVASNYGKVLRSITRNIQGRMNTRLNSLASNRIVGASIQAGQRAAQPFTEIGGAKGVAALLQGAAQPAAQRAVSFPGFTADDLVDEAMKAVGSLAKAPVAAAREYLAPRGNWFQRMGYLAGGSFIGGSAWRFVAGRGTPVTDDRGRFDVAGIPFI